ncbi:MAG TPA: peptide chain release factor-like protein [Phycisphaerae bacterium]|nr:peptide chain release factor-like protein [Phycisphaerae bacterium]
MADDAALLGDCAVDAYRSSGPGGQHRNKTSTAVRLRHQPTGLIVIAEDSRSQHENKLRAIRRLRMAIAMECRQAINEGWRPVGAVQDACTKAGRVEISRRNPSYPLVAATILDAVAARGGRLREAGELLKLTTAQLSRFLTSDAKVLTAANRIRRANGLHPLAPSK